MIKIPRVDPGIINAQILLGMAPKLRKCSGYPWVTLSRYGTVPNRIIVKSAQVVFFFLLLKGTVPQDLFAPFFSSISSFWSY